MVAAPRIRFLQKSQNKNKQDDSTANENSQDDENKDEEEEKEKKPKNKNKKMEMLRKMALERAKPLNFAEFTHQEDNNDGLFTVRKVFTPKASKVEESEEDEVCILLCAELAFFHF